MFFWRKQVPKSNASLLFVFLALVGTVMVAAAVLNLNVKRTAVDDMSGAFASRTALPSDLVGTVYSLPITVSSVPTEAYSYWDESGPQLGLVQWDTHAGSWQLVSHVRLTGEPSFVTAPEIALIGPGWGNGWILRLTGRTADGIDAVTFVRLVDGRLIQVPVDRGNGIRRVVNFEIGQTDSVQTDIAIEDLDGDSASEVVLTTAGRAGNSSVDVYLWSGDRLLRSESLSTAMTAREGLFPEPGVE